MFPSSDSSLLLLLCEVADRHGTTIGDVDNWCTLRDEHVSVTVNGLHARLEPLTITDQSCTQVILPTTTTATSMTATSAPMFSDRENVTLTIQVINPRITRNRPCSISHIIYYYNNAEGRRSS